MEAAQAVSPERSRDAQPAPLDPHPRRAVLRRLVALLAFVLVPAYVALVVFASPDYRGSDQYWYVNDVHTLLKGGSAQTNEVYPFSLMGPDRRFDAARPFVHNLPVLRVWAGAARLLGGRIHLGILAVNVALALLTALALYLALKRVSGRTAGLIGALGFLFVPVSFWMTTQDMSEPFSAALLALALYLIVCHTDSTTAWAGAQAAVVVSAVGRLWVLPFLLLIPLGFALLRCGRTRARRYATAALLLVGGIAAFLVVAPLFTSYMPSLASMSLLKVARTNNMVMYYEIANQPFHAGAFVRGLVQNGRTALELQLRPERGPFTLTPGMPGVDYHPQNVLGLACLVGLFLPMGGLKRFVCAFGAFGFATHLGLAVLYQNMPRYMEHALPGLVAGGLVVFVFLWELLAKAPVVKWPAAALVVALLAAAILIDVGNAGTYRVSALADTRRRNEVAAVIAKSVPPGARVVLDTRFGARWPMVAALYPRPVLGLATEFRYGPDVYREVVERFRGRLLVATPDSMLLSVLRVEHVSDGDGFAVYRILGTR